MGVRTMPGTRQLAHREPVLAWWLRLPNSTSSVSCVSTGTSLTHRGDFISGSGTVRCRARQPLLRILPKKTSGDPVAKAGWHGLALSMVRTPLPWARVVSASSRGPDAPLLSQPHRHP